MYSLRARILVTVTVVLLVCFGLTGIVLDLIFQRTAEQAIRERLDVQVLALLSAANVGPHGHLSMPASLPEARFANPGSGLYARITDSAGEVLWRSGSAVGLHIPYPGPLAPGVKRLARVHAADGAALFALAMGVSWELAAGGARGFTVGVAESLAPYQAQLTRFRRHLLLWFGGALVVLIAVQAATLRWLMQPLRRVEREIGEIEGGARDHLGTGYPAELAGVARNLNALIRTERARLQRYRESLGNLAHSLKTPLAVMRTSIEGGGAAEATGASSAELREQLARLDAMIGYQLRRAAMSGGITLGHRPIEVESVLRRLVDSLRKLHAQKRVDCTTEVAGGARFHGDEGDLVEILGNLLDNAFKWCRSRVRVRATPLAVPAGAQAAHRSGLLISIEDDGPGVSQNEIERIWKRGARSDESTPGQGIGLAVARELVQLHGGSLEVARSELGGAAFRVHLPPR